MNNAVVNNATSARPASVICHGVFLHDVVSERLAHLALVPEDATAGAQVRAVHLLVGERLFPDTQDYWIMQLGLLVTGSFKLIGPEIPLSSGLNAAVDTKFPYSLPLLVPRGSLLAVRFTQSGAPAPISGLSVVAEYGILSSNHASTR